jgi:hypothetical protein
MNDALTCDNLMQTSQTRPDGTHVAQIIRFHRDNKVESDKEKGIVQGRVQLKEAELVDVFSAFRCAQCGPAFMFDDAFISDGKDL